MEYIDKSKGCLVTLNISKTDYLAITNINDAEAVDACLSQKTFLVSKSSRNDGVILLKLKSEKESSVEIENTLNELKSNLKINAVIPALIDTDGFTRYFLPERIVVQFRDIDDKKVIAYLKKELNSRIIRRYRSSGLFEVSVPPDIELSDFINEINKHDKVVFAEPSYYAVNDKEIRVDISGIENPVFEEDMENAAEVNFPWNMQNIFVPQAWKVTTGNNNIIVAVVDDLPDTTHEAITDKFVAPIDDIFVFSSTSSLSSHATNICSIIAAESRQMLGVAPHILLMPLIVDLNSQTYAERADAILQAAEFALNKKINNVDFTRIILSCSWKTSGDITVIRSALEKAVSANILVVCSAGNDNTNLPHYPSEYSSWPGILGEGIISVCAVDRNDCKATYSNYSDKIDISAPGGHGLPLDEDDILCADQGNTYTYNAGTSFAVPHVAGEAALLLSLNPNLSPKDIKDIIKNNSDDINKYNPDYLNKMGKGRINTLKALAAVQEMQQSDPIPKPHDVELKICIYNAAPDANVSESLKYYASTLLNDTGWKVTIAHIENGANKSVIYIT